MKTLENYIPENIRFVLPAIAEQELPLRLFDGAKSLEEIKKVIHKNFVSTNERLIVRRHMDAAEIGTLRSNYPELIEERLPILKRELTRAREDAAIAVAKAKQDVQDAQDRLTACETQIADIANLVNDATKDVTLEQHQCYCFPVEGFYLYFAWIQDQFKLVHLSRIFERERGQLFTQGEQNLEAFVKHCHVDFRSLLNERMAYSEQAEQESEHEDGDSE